MHARVVQDTLTAAATTSATLAGNLPASADVGTTFTRSFTAYGGQGQEIPVSATYCKSADNQWEVTANGSPPVTLTFDFSGRLVEPIPDLNIVLNPPSTAVLGGGAVSSSRPMDLEVGSTETRSFLITDAQGNSAPFDIVYTRVDEDTWEAAVDGNPPVTLAYDEDGNLTTVVPPTTIITHPGAPQDLQILLAGHSQLAIEYQTVPVLQDGYAPGGFEEIEIGSNGIASAINTNGALVEMFRIPLAMVRSPNNLTVMAGNVFQDNQRSGEMVRGSAASGTYGTVVSGALEGSNVDIAEELTSMIESQRNYTANSKVFQTGSELLDVLVNLKR